MIEKEQTETMIEFLARVAIELIRENPIIGQQPVDYGVQYKEHDRDLSCLADDVESDLALLEVARTESEAVRAIGLGLSRSSEPFCVKRWRREIKRQESGD
tara:strand:- start:26007 stop:26309 length:303 start_codon:yes stop_codon:yes gene_type:complete